MPDSGPGGNIGLIVVHNSPMLDFRRIMVQGQVKSLRCGPIGLLGRSARLLLLMDQYTNLRGDILIAIRSLSILYREMTAIAERRTHPVQISKVKRASIEK